MRRLAPYALLTIIAMAVDQWIKYLVETGLPLQEKIDLLPFLAPGEPRFGPWMVCAFGRDEAACVSTAALLGGHVRVGFENNLLLPDGSTARTNADLVRAVTAVLGAAGRRTMTADEMRGAWLGS